MTFLLTNLFILLVFWRPQEWLMPMLYGWPLLNIVVGIAVLSLIIEQQEGMLKFPRTPATFLLFGLWVAGMLSHIVHGYFGGLVMVAQDVGKITFFTFLLITVLDRPGRVRVVATSMVLMAAFMAVHALLQQKTGRGFAGQLPMYVTKIDGSIQIRTVFFGIFGDPNDLAQILVASMPLAFAMPRRRSAFTTLIGLLIVGLLLTAYLTTHSRGGMIAIAGSLAVVVFMLLPARWLPAMGLLALVGGLILAGTKGGALLDMSARERVVFWGYGNQAFKHNPIFGVGYNMFWYYATGRPAHNAFVTCYTEIGFIGYWMWFNLIVMGVVGCWRARIALKHITHEEGRYLYRLAGVSIVALVGFAAGAYFLSRTFIYPFFFLMAIANAVPLMTQKYLPETHPPLLNFKKDVWVTGSIATAISIAYIYESIILLNRFAM